MRRRPTPLPRKPQDHAEARRASFRSTGSARRSATTTRTWRVVVPLGLSREELTANLCLAAIEAHRSANVTLGSVMIFAYSSEETSGAYSAGRAVYAPAGDWSKADPSAPLVERRVATELAEGYFAPKPVLLAAGDQVELIDDDARTIGISRSATSWGDADVVTRAPKGSVACSAGDQDHIPLFRRDLGRSTPAQTIHTKPGKRASGRR